MAQFNNTTASPSDITLDYFNNFLKPNLVIPQNVDEAVIGFFEKITQNKESAKLLAGAVIYTAQSQNLEPMDIIKQFAELPAGQLNGYLTLFLNLNRVGTSMLGISNAPKPSKYITRAIIA